MTEARLFDGEQLEKLADYRDESGLRRCSKCLKPMIPSVDGDFATCPDYHGKLLHPPLTDEEKLKLKNFTEQAVIETLPLAIKQENKRYKLGGHEGEWQVMRKFRVSRRTAVIKGQSFFPYVLARCPTLAIGFAVFKKVEQ